MHRSSRFLHHLFSLTLPFLLLTGLTARGQDYQKFRIMFNLTPSYTWFQTNSPRAVRTEGGTLGYNAGIKTIIFFQKNYAFSTGLFYFHNGGKIAYTDSVTLLLNDELRIPGNTKIVYGFSSLNVPIGLRLHTVAFGYLRYYFEPGMNMLFNLSSRAGVPAYFDGKENASDEARLFNLSFYVETGVEYSLGGGTALTGSLSYMRGLFDQTSDAAGKPSDRLAFNSLGLTVGIIF